MQRPASVTVFGILNILFGILGVFGTLATLLAQAALNTDTGQRNPLWSNQPVMEAWMHISLVLGSIFTVVLIIAGIGLLRLRPWGRRCSIIYAAYAILSSALGTVFMLMFVLLPMWDQMGAGQSPAQRAGLLGGMFGGLIGGLIGCIYPALLWYFMCRPHVRAAFAGTWAGPEADDPEFSLGERTPMLDVPVSSNPYATPSTHSNPPTHAGSAIDRLIPSRNGAALASYYLGLFSLFPLLGFPLAIVAIVMGVNGLKNYNENPAVRGKTHSWVGLICGVLFGLLNLLLLGGLIAGLVAARR